MKTTILISAIALLVSTMSLNAKNGVTLSNISKDEAGTKKEYIKVDKDQKPISKTYYFYDNEGNMLERVVSVWNSEKGWQERAKYEYQYTAGKNIAYTYTKWDNKNDSWGDEVYFAANIDSESQESLASK